MALCEIKNYEYLLDSLARDIERSNERTNDAKKKVHLALAEIAQVRVNMITINNVTSDEKKQKCLAQIEKNIANITELLLEILGY